MSFKMTLLDVSAHNRKVEMGKKTAAALMAAKREGEMKKKATQLIKANKGSHLEERFIAIWKELGGSELERELRFAPPRRWRFDFAHKSSMTAFELQGGVWVNGAHNRGAGMERDCEKAFAAWQLGWHVLPLTPNMVNIETITAIISKLQK